MKTCRCLLEVEYLSVEKDKTYFYEITNNKYCKKYKISKIYIDDYNSDGYCYLLKNWFETIFIDINYERKQKLEKLNGNE